MHIYWHADGATVIKVAGEGNRRYFLAFCRTYGANFTTPYSSMDNRPGDQPPLLLAETEISRQQIEVDLSAIQIAAVERPTTDVPPGCRFSARGNFLGPSPEGHHARQNRCKRN